MVRRTLIFIPGLAASLLVPAFMQPQQTKPPQKTEPQQEMPVFRNTTEIVNVLCAVRDKKGHLINTLEKPDFQIFEDGKPQEVKYFNRESQLPLTIGLLIDTSVSQGNLIRTEQQASMQFFESVLREKDMAFLISF